MNLDSRILSTGEKLFGKGQGCAVGSIHQHFREPGPPLRCWVQSPALASHSSFSTDLFPRRHHAGMCEESNMTCPLSPAWDPSPALEHGCISPGKAGCREGCPITTLTLAASIAKGTGFLLEALTNSSLGSLITDLRNLIGM